MEYKWLEGPDAAKQLNPICFEKGWPGFNELTSRAIVAHEDGRIVAFLALQLFPMLGPGYMEKDGSGVVFRHLLKEMEKFLEETQARGFMVVCENPLIAGLCERFGLKKLEHDVFVEA